MPVAGKSRLPRDAPVRDRGRNARNRNAQAAVCVAMGAVFCGEEATVKEV